MFWTYLLICMGLTCMAGMFSGLTVGIIGLEQSDLLLKEKSGTPEEKKKAAELKEIKRNHHLLLVTLLLGNALSFEALPIFLHKLFPAWAAILFSTSVILIFGEVVPMALCTGPQQFYVASKMTLIVKLAMTLFFPINWLVAKLMDKMFGEEHSKNYGREIVRLMIDQHGEVNEENKEDKDIFGPDEVRILQSTIEIRDITVEKIMVPFKNIFMIKENETINQPLIQKIIKRHFSRIPVYKDDKNNVVGVISSKSLLKYKECLNKTLRESGIIYRPLIVARDTNLLEMMSIFKENNATIALVSDQLNKNQLKNEEEKKHWKTENSIIDNYESRKSTLIGLIALKDLFEKMCKIELDDTDVHIYSIQPENRVNSLTKGLPKKDPVELEEAQEGDEYTPNR